MPGQRLQFLYFIGYFQPISLDSSTKFGHSIPWPLDLDDHGVKVTGDALHCQVEYPVRDKKIYFILKTSPKWVDTL
jgi:hypothetical protein